MLCASSYEMGLSSAAILSTRITEKFHPKYLCMTGIAGGVKLLALIMEMLSLQTHHLIMRAGKKLMKMVSPFLSQTIDKFALTHLS